MSSILKKMRRAHEQRRVDAWVHAGKGTRPETPNPEATADRLGFVEHHAATIAADVARYLDEGGALEDIVVMVVDVDDPIGQRIAKALRAGQDATTNAIRGAGEIPTLIAILPRAVAADGFAGSNPGVSERLKDPAPTGRYYVASVASGGTLLLALELKSDGGES